MLAQVGKAKPDGLIAIGMDFDIGPWIEFCQKRGAIPTIAYANIVHMGRSMEPLRSTAQDAVGAYAARGVARYRGPLAPGLVGCGAPQGSRLPLRGLLRRTQKGRPDRGGQGDRRFLRASRPGGRAGLQAGHARFGKALCGAPPDDGAARLQRRGGPGSAVVGSGHGRASSGLHGPVQAVGRRNRRAVPGRAWRLRARLRPAPGPLAPRASQLHGQHHVRQSGQPPDPFALHQPAPARRTRPRLPGPVQPAEFPRQRGREPPGELARRARRRRSSTACRWPTTRSSSPRPG